MSTEQALQITTPETFAISPDELIRRRKVIQQVMKSVMKEGVHFGIQPGTDKMALRKPGAEALCSTFKLAPRYLPTRYDLGNGHREYEVKTFLEHAETKTLWAEGLGSCSTMEAKYRYRKAARVCPDCNAETIMKSKFEDGGWYCNQNRGGCGAKFESDDPTIVDQESGKIENPDIADQWNTVLKMATKRSYLHAVISATGASDMFTPDEDEDEEGHPKQQQKKTQPQATKQAESNQDSLSVEGIIRSFSLPNESQKKPGKFVLEVAGGKTFEVGFWSRPEAVKNVPPQDVIGKACRIGYINKSGANGRVFTNLVSFSFVEQKDENEPGANG